MNAAAIDLPVFVTEREVERCYQQGILAQRRRQQGRADAAMRAARARDPRLLLALEKGAEVLLRVSERQLGKGYNIGGIAISATEHNLWRSAYETVEKGEPIRHLEWIYFMAGYLAGLIV